MKIESISPAMINKIELGKLTQQETIKQQQLKVIKERQIEIERMRPQDPDKGQNVDVMV